ncbi:hypothetical protein [Streptomyces sp. NPDC127100]|uniref:hypothetical protein n=1 Tax=Streptomyces sp. NPDC127100 TaxID=3347138 RepID=UPI0036481203
MAAEQPPGGHDALMAAITGEPLPPGADAGARDAYRAATADVALLREQLGIIGRTLGDAPATEPDTLGFGEPELLPPFRSAPRPGPRSRRRRGLVLGALAAACAGAVVAGLGWSLPAGGGSADSASSAAKEDTGGPAHALGTADYLACAATVAEGRVTGTAPVPGAGTRITMRVTRLYKPEPGPGPDGRKAEEPGISFLLDGDAPVLRAGDALMIGIPRGGSAPDEVVTGEQDVAAVRAEVVASLPGSRTVGCDG